MPHRALLTPSTAFLRPPSPSYTPRRPLCALPRPFNALPRPFTAVPHPFNVPCRRPCALSPSAHPTAPTPHASRRLHARPRPLCAVSPSVHFVLPSACSQCHGMSLLCPITPCLCPAGRLAPHHLNAAPRPLCAPHCRLRSYLFSHHLLS
ncbi:hypothetical protein DENSPDRAFT_887117 [Dentipellis sp. KUC8613]|nr:hypothetical protein DENSPDRAFT_887117 [Dentipellis sp. KUC8613]